MRWEHKDWNMEICLGKKYQKRLTNMGGQHRDFGEDHGVMGGKHRDFGGNMELWEGNIEILEGTWSYGRAT